MLISVCTVIRIYTNRLLCSNLSSCDNTKQRKMGEPAKEFEVNSDPILSNAGATRDLGNSPSFRNPVPSTSTASPVGPPVLPPRPDLGMQQSYGMNQGYYGGMGGSYGMGAMGGYGGYGMGTMGGYGGYGGGYGMGGMGMGSPYGGYSSFRPMYGDMESR